MGYIRNEAIIVTGWDKQKVVVAQEAATVIFNAAKMGGLVSGLTLHAINGGAAFFIAPDGSKEGWEDSNIGAVARTKFIDWLNSPKAAELYLSWALVVVGGDDDEYRVLQSASQPVDA